MSIQDMPDVDSLGILYKFYIVINKPALLAGMYPPDAQMPWHILYKMGFTDVF